MMIHNGNEVEGSTPMHTVDTSNEVINTDAVESHLDERATEYEEGIPGTIHSGDVNVVQNHNPDNTLGNDGVVLKIDTNDQVGC